MLRSMYAGVSGLKAHMQKMDIVGNNIANVNTTGFKASRATFKTMLSQTIEGATAPQDERGGTNPQQIGLGVSLGSIDKDMSQGNLKSTGRKTDLAIQGDGFFVLNAGGSNSYTRSGSLTFDKNGYLVNSTNGYRIQGWMADDHGNIDTSGELQDLTLKQSMEAQRTENVTYAGNLDSSYTSNDKYSKVVTVEDSSNNKYRLNIEFSQTATADEWDYKITSAENLSGESVSLAGGSTGTIEFDSDTGKYSSTITSQDVNIDTNGDGNPDQTIPENNLTFSTWVAREPNASRQTTIQVYDSQGKTHTASVEFLKSDNKANAWSYVVNGVTDADVKSGAKGTLSFDASGNIESGMTQVLEFTPDGGAMDNQQVELDFSQLTQFGGDMTAAPDTVGGYGAGSLENFTIGGSGVITGQYDNGKRKDIGQTALATFNNPAGLKAKAGTMFTESNNSGQAKIGTPNTGGFGSLSAGTLEMSNVDLSRQFTEMITTQRGFQANSKTISTSNQILQVLVNLKR